MCLAMPVQVTEILENQRAIVTIGGVKREISTVLMDVLSPGNFVILHAGYAIAKLNEDEALRTLQLFATFA